MPPNRESTLDLKGLMLKYRFVALALKASSLNSTTRSLYRRVANSIGARRRATRKIPGYYFNRVDRNLRWCAKYGRCNQMTFSSN